MQEERNCQPRASEQAAMKATTSKKRGICSKSSSGQQNQQKQTCTHCKKDGHTADYCRKRMSELVAADNKRNGKEKAHKAEERPLTLKMRNLLEMQVLLTSLTPVPPLFRTLELTGTVIQVPLAI